MKKLKRCGCLGFEHRDRYSRPGYSSLGLSAKIPVHSLRSTLVHHHDAVKTRHHDAFSTIISMAHALRAPMVAEASMLRNSQGNWSPRRGIRARRSLSKPLPFDDMTSLLGPGWAEGKARAQKKKVVYE